MFGQNRNLFELEWSGGAPPERFFQADKFTTLWGQNWGNSNLYKWQAHEKEKLSLVDLAAVKASH